MTTYKIYVKASEHGTRILATSDKDARKIIASVEQLHEQRVERACERVDWDDLIDRGIENGAAFPQRPSPKIVKIPVTR